MKKNKFLFVVLVCFSCILMIGSIASAADTKVQLEYRLDENYVDSYELYMGGNKGTVFTREMDSGNKLTAFGVWVCEKGNPKNNSKTVEMSLLNDVTGLRDNKTELTFHTGDIISTFNGVDAKVSTENGFMFTNFYAETTPKIIIKVTPDISLLPTPEPTAEPTPEPTKAPKPITNLTLSNAYIFGDSGSDDVNITNMSATRNISREEACALIGRILYQNGYYDEFDLDTAPKFNDVTPDNWSYKHIEYVAAQGAFNGKSGIDPSGLVTRGEVAHIFSAALHLDKQADLDGFDDIDPAYVYYSDIGKAVAAGLFVGDENSNINPNAKITRAEVVTIINRIIGRDSSFYKLETADGASYTDYYFFPDLEQEKDAWYYEQMVKAASAYDENGYIDPNMRLSRGDLDN